MNNRKMISRLIIFIISAVLITGCVSSRAAIKSDYDFTKIKRIGVLRFANYSKNVSSGAAVADEFIRQLLIKNINVVERINLDRLIQEQDLNSSGYLNPETAKKAKELLGVDAIITGTVMEYSPRVRRQQSDITTAEVSISARMIDVETGSVVWANSYTYDAMDIQTAIEWTISDLLNSLKGVWPQLNKK
ncbi:MAG: GNA1162 family protein [bacterium]